MAGPAPRVVMMVASSAGFGGGERNLLDVARGALADGWSVVVAVPAAGRLSALLDADGIAWHAIPLGSVPGATLALRRLYREISPDIVHAHGLRASLPARLARMGASTKLVYSLHGLHYLHYPSELKRAVFQAGERVLRPLADRFVCVSDADAASAEAVRAVVPQRTVVIRNGVSAPPEVDRGSARAAFAPDGRPVIVTLTRLEPEKGVDVLLDAVERLEPGTARVLVAGEGSRRTTLETRARSRSLPVRFLGFRDDVAALLAAADVFVLTSRWEGLPYTVLEAMASGLPVVAPRVGGVPEAVADGESGFLVAPGDAAGFADALARLVGDAALRQRMGEAGRRRWAEAFTLDEMRARFAELYEELAPRAIDR